MNRQTLPTRPRGFTHDTPVREKMGRNYIKTAPRRCSRTVVPRGLADCEGVDYA